MDLIERNDKEQTLRCRHCNAKRHIPWRKWIRQDEKMDAIEAFTAGHDDCRLLQLQALKIQFFSRPFRPSSHSRI